MLESFKEQFKEEIPNIETLVKQLEKMLSNPSYTLQDILEAIVDHIIEEKESEAWAIAFNAVDHIIDELEVNDLNFKRLLDYIKDYDCYNAYNRLIMDFEEFLSEDKRRELIENGRKIFVKEITQHWD